MDTAECSGLSLVDPMSELAKVSAADDRLSDGCLLLPRRPVWGNRWVELGACEEGAVTGRGE